MTWATARSRSSFYWLYRASPSLATKHNQSNFIGVRLSVICQQRQVTKVHVLRMRWYSHIWTSAHVYFIIWFFYFFPYSEEKGEGRRIVRSGSQHLREIFCYCFSVPSQEGRLQPKGSEPRMHIRITCNCFYTHAQDSALQYFESVILEKGRDLWEELHTISSELVFNPNCSS